MSTAVAGESSDLLTLVERRPPVVVLAMVVREVLAKTAEMKRQASVAGEGGAEAEMEVENTKWWP